MLNMNAVLFDMDGVLIDSETPSFALLHKTLAKQGIDISLKDLLADYTGVNSNAIYAALIERFGLNKTVDEFRRDHRRISGSFYVDGELLPMPGLIRFMDYLCKRNIKMAVVSSTSGANVLAALNRLSLIRYLDAIVTGDMVGRPKPSPEGYLAAVRYLRVKPAECLVIEDSPIGIRAAKNAGIFVVGFKGSEHIQDTSAADKEKNSFEGLERWISSFSEK
jgi:HAD superfamily hydrolase (TIGR01509 family)